MKRTEKFGCAVVGILGVLAFSAAGELSGCRRAKYAIHVAVSQAL